MDKKQIIYCDFDGTITKEDSVKNFLERFADHRWKNIEKLWEQEKIGSKECLLRQINLIKTLSSDEMEEFISEIEIDNTFLDFYDFAKTHGIDLVILSDGLDIIINGVLIRYNLSDIMFYANSLVIKDNKPYIYFPNESPECSRSSGSCKCSKITRKDFYYIGDGLSDVCIAKKARTLFAKHNLKNYCDKNKIDYVPFRSFKNIMDYLKDEGGFNAKFEGFGIR